MTSHKMDHMKMQNFWSIFRTHNSLIYTVFVATVKCFNTFTQNIKHENIKFPHFMEGGILNQKEVGLY